jgi:hypothetical protein
MNRNPDAGAANQKHCAPAGRVERRQLLRLAAAAPLTPLLAGCSSLTRGDPPPAALAEQVTVLGIPNGRFWPGTQAEAMAREAIESVQRERAALGITGPLPPAYFLAVSGGGDDGAFGAGLLCGWHDAGTIPTFKLVTGVSTGSMIAPFAFLGGAYYDRLRTMYTTITPSSVLKPLGLYGVLFGDALASTTPLFDLISYYLDERMFADIAAAYRNGRLLLIGSTSLDMQRPIIWNIGAIAASGQPGALELVHKILLASAAVPGAFPPVLIDVEAGGRRYQEMNVDGGAVAQTFLYPPNIPLVVNMNSRELARPRYAYIIRNGRLDPNWADVRRQFLDIAGRSIATMIHYSGYNDILRIYETTQRDGVDYNLAFIGPDFTTISREQFDPVYMRQLFDYGYVRGRAGYPWQKKPPILDVRLQTAQETGRAQSRGTVPP